MVMATEANVGPRPHPMGDLASGGRCGGTPREVPTDGTPRKKRRLDRTKAVAAIKGGREAKTLREEADDASVDDDKVASGRRLPTMATRRGRKRQERPSHHGHNRRRCGQRQ